MAITTITICITDLIRDDLMCEKARDERNESGGPAIQTK